MADPTLTPDLAAADAAPVPTYPADGEQPAEDGLTPEAMQILADRRERSGFYVDPQVRSDIEAATELAAPAVIAAEPYIDPQVQRDADAAIAASLPPAAQAVPEVYIDPLDGPPAAPTIAPPGQVLITNPDLPGSPVGSCFPEALTDTWADKGWEPVDPTAMPDVPAPTAPDPIPAAELPDAPPSDAPPADAVPADAPAPTDAPPTDTAGTPGTEG